ncbi:MAG: DUF5818 domain-containing protein [Myxococcota bacterium]|nr:DUF5818 domain-containing protein [Myxococcota bacterium]
MTLQGTLSREFFGGEVWVLRTQDGQAYQLQGQVPPKLEGKQVEVIGEASDAAFGVAMVGPILDIKRLRAL